MNHLLLPPAPATAALDGIHTLLPRSRMTESARKYRDYYAITPGMPFFRAEFGFYCLDAWKAQGMPQDVPKAEIFGYDAPGNHSLGQLGWCEAGFAPVFETKVLEDRGAYELVQDFAGRHVLFFKNRRNGFMPEYLDHPVKDMKTWVENVKWRMDPKSPERWVDHEARMENARAKAGQGLMIVQNIVGAYMYLRSLIGPERLLYAFYDMPDVVHDCLKTWFELADAVSAAHQQQVTVDEIYFGEDICYNKGPLISPDMIREFLFPYYQQLIANVRARNIDRNRHLYVNIDTDGYVVPIIDVYKEIGMDVMNPFEVASNCDVVEIGKRWPDLVMRGGIDKRILAESKEAIDRMLERILPVMRKRGGYYPTCDHGVPEEVPYENYLHYRKRCMELGG
ncbi:MAG TPA: uroporphyrinogen decarboxylase family protein [Planctomycetota bacterium]|nr:uroporphyrinogen decarboxylase family protein [Planctomycetota bacterium]